LLVAAAAALGLAVTYLCLTLANVISSTPREAAVAVLESAGDNPDDHTPAPDDASGADAPSDPPGSVSGPLPGLADAVGDPELLAVVKEALGDGADHASVAVRRISDGRSASVNGDYQFYAASTFKLAVLYEAERRHFNGDLDYDDAMFLSEEAAAEDLGTSGYLEFEEDGSITIQHLLEAMITVSDNSSAVALLREFGSGNVDATLRSLGIENMTVNKVELWTTAADLARLMEAIYVGEGVGSEEREHMRTLLLGQTIRSGIPAAIEDEFGGSVLIGNKTGTWEGAQHDVAFVEAQTGAYVIAILTDGSFEGWDAMHRVARDVHEKFAATP
jgi:beta-lactamase class A